QRKSHEKGRDAKDPSNRTGQSGKEVRLVGKQFVLVQELDSPAQIILLPKLKDRLQEIGIEIARGRCLVVASPDKTRRPVRVCQRAVVSHGTCRAHNVAGLGRFWTRQPAGGNLRGQILRWRNAETRGPGVNRA